MLSYPMVCPIYTVNADTYNDLLPDSKMKEQKTETLGFIITLPLGFLVYFIFSDVLFVHTQYLLLHRHVLSVGSNSWEELPLNQTSQCLFILPIRLCSKWFCNSFDQQILDLVITEF